MTKVYEYVKVKLQLINGITKLFWAEKYQIKNSLYIKYIKCSRSGETNPNERIEVFYAHPNDIIWEKTATLNLKYAELELI